MQLTKAEGSTKILGENEAMVSTPADIPLAELRAIIRAKINSRALPAEPPSHIWARKGTGLVCRACDLAIMPAEHEYEVKVVGRVLHVHRECLAVWHNERGADPHGPKGK